MATQQTIGIGLVGSGFMARTYAETLAKYVKGGKLVAVAVGKRAPQLAQDYGADFESSLEDLVARPDIQGVIITTPEPVHLSQVRVAAAAGKHVLVEKPMAPSVAECTEMINVCRKAGVKYMQVQSQRFRAIHQKAHQMLDEGRIGPIWQVRLVSMLAKRWTVEAIDDRPWYVDPAGGGIILSQIAHNFDMMRWVVGSEATKVFAQGKTYGDAASKGTPILDLSLQAQVAFANGAAGQLWVCMETPGVSFPQSTFRTQVIGEQGLLDFDGYTHLDLGTPDGKWERIMTQPTFNSMDPLDPIRLGSFTAQNQEFVDAIRDNRTPAVTGEDGRAAVEMGLAAILSCHTGKLIELPLIG
ncbi:MAG: Gfo/Idh/MocA family oxidoreductase [Chloroflexi bacterium]|nr:Gfo/Idh/MocA family oxidoreductase [Chloroflexota bacterium]